MRGEAKGFKSTKILMVRSQKMAPSKSGDDTLVLYVTSRCTCPIVQELTMALSSI